MLTQEALKAQLNYDPITGIFTRLVSNNYNVKVGDITGSTFGCGYLSIYVLGRAYLAHRLAFLYMTGSFPKDDIDHINLVRDDNRWENLREASRSQNCLNKSLRSDNKSGHKGVTWHKATNKWQASCMAGTKRKYLGVFDKIDDAISAYTSFAKLHHGEFYRAGNEVEH